MSSKCFKCGAESEYLYTGAYLRAGKKPSKKSESQRQHEEKMAFEEDARKTLAGAPDEELMDLLTVVGMVLGERWFPGAKRLEAMELALRKMSSAVTPVNSAVGDGNRQGNPSQLIATFVDSIISGYQALTDTMCPDSEDDKFLFAATLAQEFSDNAADIAAKHSTPKRDKRTWGKCQ